MARALECPACGARHRLDTLPDTPTFRCDRCGQVLKVPDAVVASRQAGGDGAATATGAGGAVAAATAPAPPPRRRGGGAPTGPTVSATSSATATLPATVAAANAGGQDDGSRRARRAAQTAPPPERTKVRLYWRIVAWVVAVPLGFVITAWPAFELGLIKKDDVLDVFVGEGSGRYLRLLIGAAIWALVTALLVQLFVEGGRAYAARRRARGARDVDTAAPPSARPRRPAAKSA